MDNGSDDPQKNVNVMRQTRRRRKYFFSTVLIYIPAIFVTHEISPTNRAMGTLFVLWVTVLIIVTFLVALSKCPRCGNYFHLHGMTLLILRKCLHCQLHIKESEWDKADLDQNCS